MDKRIRDIFHNNYAKRKTRKKLVRHLLLSVISLIIIMMIIVTASFSWFTISNSSLGITSFELDCGKGLRVNDSGTSQLNFSTNYAQLIPASSVDGRNLYFPTNGADFSKETALMTYRSANAGDKNIHYIQIDFTLTAQQNHTALYINTEKTSIRVADIHQDAATEEAKHTHSEDEWSVPQAAALRSALWSSTAQNGMPNTPIVFNPTLNTVRMAAVNDVDRATGAFISTDRQIAHAFSDYSFGGTPVATLSRNEETRFSYIIWLEGTDPKCTDKMIDKDIEIRLAFSTSWDNTQTIRFEDRNGLEIDGKSLNTLINVEKSYNLRLIYEETTGDQQTTPFNMYKYNNSTNTWFCNIPGDMRNAVSFELRPVNGNGDVYQFRYNTNNQSTLDRGANRLYVADDLNAVAISELNYKGHGHWIAVGDSDGTGHDSGNLDGDDF